MVSLIERGANYTDTASFDAGDTFTPNLNDIIVVIANFIDSTKTDSITSMSGWGESFSEIVTGTGGESEISVWAARITSNAPGSDAVAVVRNSGGFHISYSVIQIQGCKSAGTLASVFNQIDTKAMYIPPRAWSPTFLNGFTRDDSFMLCIQGGQGPNAGNWIESNQGWKRLNQNPTGIGQYYRNGSFGFGSTNRTSLINFIGQTQHLIEMLAEPTPFVRSKAGSNEGASTAFDATIPSSVEPGDLLLAGFAVDGSTADPTVSNRASATETDGWKVLEKYYQPSGQAHGLLWAYKVADGTEGGREVRISFTPNEAKAAVVWAIGNAADPAKVPLVLSPLATGSSASPQGNAVQLRKDADHLVISTLFKASGSSTSTVSGYPASYNNTISENPGGFDALESVSAAVRSITTGAESETPGAFTLSSSDTWAVSNIAIAPKSAEAALDAPDYRNHRALPLPKELTPGWPAKGAGMGGGTLTADDVEVDWDNPLTKGLTDLIISFPNEKAISGYSSGVDVIPNLVNPTMGHACSNSIDAGTDRGYQEVRISGNHCGPHPVITQGGLGNSSQSKFGTRGGTTRAIADSVPHTVIRGAVNESESGVVIGNGQGGHGILGGYDEGPYLANGQVRAKGGVYFGSMTFTVPGLQQFHVAITSDGGGTNASTIKAYAVEAGLSASLSGQNSQVNTGQIHDGEGNSAVQHPDLNHSTWLGIWEGVELSQSQIEAICADPWQLIKPKTSATYFAKPPQKRKKVVSLPKEVHPDSLPVWNGTPPALTGEYEIDWSNPITHGLIVAFIPGQGKNLVTGSAFTTFKTLGDGTNLDWLDETPWLRGTNNGGSNPGTGGLIEDDVRGRLKNHEITLLAIANTYDRSGAADNSTLIEIAENSNYNFGSQAWLRREYSAYYFQCSQAGVGVWQAASTSNHGNWDVVIGRRNSTTSGHMFLNGVKSSEETTDISTVDWETNSGSVCIGGHLQKQYSPDSTLATREGDFLALGLAWNRPLSDDEAYSMSENPYQIFKPVETVAPKRPRSEPKLLHIPKALQPNYNKLGNVVQTKRTLVTANAMTATFDNPVQAGNLIIAVAVQGQVNCGGLIPPAGFTHLLLDWWISGQARFYHGWKIADGTETSITVEWSTGAAAPSSVEIIEFSWDGSTPNVTFDFDGALLSGARQEVSMSARTKTAEAPNFAVAFLSSDSGQNSDGGQLWSNGDWEDIFTLTANLNAMSAIAVAKEVEGEVNARHTNTDTADGILGGLTIFESTADLPSVTTWKPEPPVALVQSDSKIQGNQESNGITTINMPDSLEAGDMILLVGLSSVNNEFSDNDQNFNFNYTPFNSGGGMAFYGWREAGTENPYVLDKPLGTHAWAIGALRFDNWNKSQPIGAFASSIDQNVTAPAVITAPAITPLSSNSKIVRYWVSEEGSTAEYNALGQVKGEIGRSSELGDGRWVVVAVEDSPGAGISTGTSDLSYDFGSDPSASAFTLEVLPATYNNVPTSNDGSTFKLREGDPIAAKVAFCAIVQGTDFKDIVSGEAIDITAQTGWSVLNDNEQGRVLELNGAGSAASFDRTLLGRSGTGINISNELQISGVMWSDLIDDPGSDLMQMSGAGTDTLLNWGRASNEDFLQRVGSPTSTQSYVITMGGNEWQQWNVFSSMRKTGVGQRGNRNGVNYAWDSTYTDEPLSPTHDPSIMGNEWDGKVSMIVIFDSLLTDTENTLFAQNPWRILEVQGPVTLSAASLNLTNVSPAQVKDGQTGVVLTGTGFGDTQGASSVTINGVTQTISSWSDTSITLGALDLTGVPLGDGLVIVNVV